MSVIHDALKTAQREKQSREAGIRGGGSPLIVPMRGGKDESEFSWKNTVTIAVASVVIVGASWSLWVRMRNLIPRPAIAFGGTMMELAPEVNPTKSDSPIVVIQPQGNATEKSSNDVSIGG